MDGIDRRTKIRPPDQLERPDAPVSRWRRARARLLRPLVLVSLLVHALVLGVLLLLPPSEASFSPEGPSYEMVLDGGVPSPSPGQQTASVAPGTPAPTPPAPEAPAPEPIPAAPQQTAPPRVNIPTPELSEALPLPEPLPPPPLPQVAAPPRPRVVPPPVRRPQPSPRNPSGFPAPQNWSLNGGLQAQPSPHPQAGQGSTFGPAMGAPRFTGADLGPDWAEAYSNWVRAHLYYPEQARENGEDGTTEVILTINRYGKVMSVELVTRSGSQWLDLETTGMFRGAHVPPFPQNVTGDTVTVDQTIDYRLIRRR